MTVKNQELHNVIEKLPEELLIKVLDYNAPKELVVKDEKDLRKKLEDGIKDFENGNVCSLDKAYLEILAD